MPISTPQLWHVTLAVHLALLNVCNQVLHRLNYQAHSPLDKFSCRLVGQSLSSFSARRRPNHKGCSSQSQPTLFQTKLPANNNEVVHSLLHAATHKFKANTGWHPGCKQHYININAVQGHCGLLALANKNVTPPTHTKSQLPSTRPVRSPVKLTAQCAQSQTLQGNMFLGRRTGAALPSSCPSPPPSSSPPSSSSCCRRRPELGDGLGLGLIPASSAACPSSS